ncbi:MAG: ATPase, T2SS/T4P/T4SS family, partial [Acidobacteriota bacterium]
MATDPRSLYKNADPTGEAARAQRMADQYGFPYVDLDHFQVDHDLFRNIPLELMIRYQFLPEKRENGHIAVVVGDPTDVLKMDELELLLGAPLKVKVASPAAIRDKLQKSESTQRVLDEATEGLTIDSITAQESSPIIKLVDSIVFNAIQRRASDIHIETRDNEVVVKYRIDGVLYEALDPIDKRHHSTIISRIKVMSELDIAEKRVPQDGRFKLRITGRTIDFRV